MAATTIAANLGLDDRSVEAMKAALSGEVLTLEQWPLKESDDDFEPKKRQAGFTHAQNMAGSLGAGRSVCSRGSGNRAANGRLRTRLIHA
ncbi:hypothetical protein [Burkholderia sp. Nafp2/4-1b]|uniref:hypothetical protein n=1 Tax=Burkholderia sp. Nafp2/4-1b TaxID=2116686 RepID=UPI0013CF3A5D|nr:hypothetical protein [Burkholderia sp. Nafp2/4-1b]